LDDATGKPFHGAEPKNELDPTPTPPLYCSKIGHFTEAIDMAVVAIRDDTIWVNHIEGGKVLKERIASLPPGDVIELEVDGIVGSWEKTQVGKDGRPQQSIKPLGNMKTVWKRFQSRRQERVEIREVRTADAYLAALTDTLSEWNSPEDEEAFRDL
jgi:hypothetical protein